MIDYYLIHYLPFILFLLTTPFCLSCLLFLHFPWSPNIHLVLIILTPHVDLLILLLFFTLFYLSLPFSHSNHPYHYFLLIYSLFLTIPSILFILSSLIILKYLYFLINPSLPFSLFHLYLSNNLNHFYLIILIFLSHLLDLFSLSYHINILVIHLKLLHIHLIIFQNKFMNQNYHIH